MPQTGIAETAQKSANAFCFVIVVNSVVRISADRATIALSGDQGVELFLG